MQMKLFMAATIAALGLAACNAKEPADARPAMVPVGEPVACIDTIRIRSTNVIDDQTIDFHMAGGDILRNTLPNRCPSLGFQKSFAYKTSLPRLCSVDIITVIDTAGGVSRGASCGLGQFQPVKKAEASEAATPAAE